MIAALATFPEPKVTTIPSSGCRIGYLLSQYPAVSHSFLLNEVLQLKQHGLAIEVASINAPDRPLEMLSRDERIESASCFYVKSLAYAKVAGTLLRILFSHPLVCSRGILAAIKLAEWDLRKQILSLFYFIEALLVGDWMRRRTLSHLHIHFCGPVATVGLLTSIAWRYPYSLTLHGSDEFYDVSSLHVRQKIESASFVICISDFCRSQIMRISDPEHWTKLEVIRLGVDPEVFVPARRKRKREVFQIVCVGRLVAAKGQLVLLDALKDLVETGYRIHLCLVGDGESRKHIESFVTRMGLSSVVHLHGALGHEETRRVLQSADLFVLASFAEGVPVALMEAMAMEIPCVSTRIAGIPELIRDDIDGLLVPASSKSSLVSAIRRLIDDPQLYGRLGRAARQRVLALYNLADNTNTLMHAFSERVLSLHERR